MSASLLQSFHARLQRIDRTRSRMESLLDAGHVLVTDVESIYESLFLRAVTGFEGFCDDLFWTILQDRIRFPSKARVSRKVSYSTALRSIIFQKKSYLTWLPYENTEELAHLCFVKGRPFTILSGSEKQQLSTIVTVRHAIAHKSEHATRKFHKSVIGNLHLLRHEKTPAGFLRSVITHPQRRFEAYLGHLGLIAAKIHSGG